MFLEYIYYLLIIIILGNIVKCRNHRRYGFDPWVRNTPWRRAWQPIPILLPGEFHGQRSLAGYSP